MFWAASLIRVELRKKCIGFTCHRYFYLKKFQVSMKTEVLKTKTIITILVFIW